MIFVKVIKSVSFRKSIIIFMNTVPTYLYTICYCIWKSKFHWIHKAITYS